VDLPQLNRKKKLKLEYQKLDCCSKKKEHGQKIFASLDLFSSSAQVCF